MKDFSNQESIDLATKPISKLLFQFAAPAIIAMSANSIYNLCDSIFIGQGAGPMAISGIAIAFPLMNIISAFAALTSVGASVNMSINMGKNDRDTAIKIFGNMISLCIIFSIVLGSFGLVFLNPILSLFGASNFTLPFAKDYMQIILCGLIITFSFQGMAAQLRAIGHPNQAMVSQLIAVVSNLILDPIFIFVLNMGVRGAAIATILGQIIAWLYIIRFFINKESFVYFHRKALILEKSIVRNIVSVGLSPFCMSLCGCLIVVAINQELLSHGGDDSDLYVGANGITTRVTQLIVMMVSGFTQGLQPIVGFNLGAQQYKRVCDTAKLAMGIATVIMTVGYILIAIFPAQIASWFTTDQELINICVPAMRISICMFPFVASQMTIVAFFQSIKRPKLSIAISLTRQLIFLLPLLLIIPDYLGVTGVWWSMSIADIFSVILTWVLYCKVLHKFSVDYNLKW